MRVEPCVEHAGCLVVVEGDWPTAPGSWISHAPDAHDPATRLNLDHPVVGTVTWRMPSAAEWAVQQGRDEEDPYLLIGLRDLAAMALVRAEDPAHPLPAARAGAIVSAAGMSVAQLRERAARRGLRP